MGVVKTFARVHVGPSLLDFVFQLNYFALCAQLDDILLSLILSSFVEEVEVKQARQQNYV